MIKEWEARRDKLKILHYHGDKDLLFEVDPLEKHLREFLTSTLGIKHFSLEVEKALGHEVSLKGFIKCNEFMLTIIENSG